MSSFLEKSKYPIIMAKAFSLWRWSWMIYKRKLVEKISKVFCKCHQYGYRKSKVSIMKFDSTYLNSSLIIRLTIKFLVFTNVTILWTVFFICLLWVKKCISLSFIFTVTYMSKHTEQWHKSLFLRDYDLKSNRT